MLKYLVPAFICLFALLSACEPSGSESMEPVMATGPDIAPINKETDSGSPAPPDSNARLALDRVNALRQQGCKCGDQQFPATTKVSWNSELYAAALAHANDMLTHKYFSHTSPSGENVYHRLIKAGYISDAANVSAYGENIAFGDFDSAMAIQKWLESPTHCANMMRAAYLEMAIAHDGNYWVQVFGAKRK